MSIMKPIAIFRQARSEGPGHFATFLDAHGIPWEIVDTERASVIPGDPAAFSGIGLMGGVMSVNDDLPWIAPTLDLIRTAIAGGTPVIGHCLGGQLMSCALGGTVGPNPVKEIGWGEVTVEPTHAGRHWLGDRSSFLSFHWHGETFTTPAGATRIASSAWCGNQMFVLGPHLGMQCHVEMTEQMIQVWARGGAKELRDNRVPSVQSAEAMLTDLEARVADLHTVAETLYARWVENLKI